MDRPDRTRLDGARALAWVVGLRLPGIALASEIGERLVCAVRLTEDCANEPGLRAANGSEVAALLRDHAPALLYEDGMRTLPVDFRACRSDACAEGPVSGAVTRTSQGRRVVAFTHVIDCRRGTWRAPKAGAATARARAPATSTSSTGSTTRAARRRRGAPR